MNPSLILRFLSNRSQLGLIPSNKSQSSVNFAEREKERANERENVYCFNAPFIQPMVNGGTKPPTAVIYPPLNCAKSSELHWALQEAERSYPCPAPPSQYQFHQIRLSSKVLLSVMMSCCTLGSILQKSLKMKRWLVQNVALAVILKMEHLLMQVEYMCLRIKQYLHSKGSSAVASMHWHISILRCSLEMSRL